jgi:hypothetical protein
MREVNPQRGIHLQELRERIRPAMEISLVRSLPLINQTRTKMGEGNDYEICTSLV